jgi:2-polyprenyl-6-methoxyphenol hydroxylase-like FAD-dependent oxidoreductase
MTADVEVVVVGGGYIGLAAAVELGLRGVRTLVVEQDLEIPAWHPRAVQLEARTMEIFRRWGIADAVRSLNPLPPGFERFVGFGTSLTGSLITTVPLWTSTGGPTGALASGDGAWLSQFRTERLLEDRARSLESVEILRGWRAAGIEQDESGVEVTIESVTDGRSQRVRASYVIGADGASSVVRKQAGIEYEGPGEVAHWLYVPFYAPSLINAGLFAKSIMYFLVGAGRITVARPTDSENWDIQIPNVPPDAPLSQEELTRLVRDTIGRDDIPFELGPTAPVRLHDLIAGTWRSGRAFVVGNAAHLIVHTGGHNGNTGVSDAVNIGWKIAAVLRGWGGETLLDSYESERRPIALRVRAKALSGAQETAQTMMHLAQTNAFGTGADDDEAARREFVEAVELHAERNWDANGVSLDQRYDSSPVVIANGTVVPEWDPRALSPIVAPGHRAPHVPEGDGGSIHDQFGSGFVLLRLDDAADDGEALVRVARDRGVPLTALDRPAVRYRDAYGKGLTLVRPDGHIAWSGETLPSDLEGLLDTVTGRGSDRARDVVEAAATTTPTG